MHTAYNSLVCCLSTEGPCHEILNTFCCPKLCIWAHMNRLQQFRELFRFSEIIFCQVRNSWVNSAWCSASLLSIFFRLCGAPCSNLICCFFHQFSLNLNLRFGFFPAGCFYILKFENNLSLPSTSWQACLLA